MKFTITTTFTATTMAAALLASSSKFGVFGMTNPAADCCADNGGELSTMQTRAGEAGVCTANGVIYDEWTFFDENCGTKAPTQAPIIGMPNPAAECCTSNGGTLSSMSSTDGESSICTKDGNQFDEWLFFDQNCSEKTSAPIIGGMPNPAAACCTDNGGTLSSVSTRDGETSICTKDGQQIDEWKFFDDNCSEETQAPLLGGSDSNMADVGAEEPEPLGAEDSGASTLAATAMFAVASAATAMLL